MFLPAAWLICSAFSPSEARIWDCLQPSATLMAASRWPSDSSTVALFLRSASTCTPQKTLSTIPDGTQFPPEDVLPPVN